MSIRITAEHVQKTFDPDKPPVIRDLSLDIHNGEFFTLLGPSGCGKTTFLRTIAGFYDLDGGTLRFDDKIINSVPAHQRNIGMVFQNYAIFPHLTTAQNVAYGLKMRKVKGQQLKRQVNEMLGIVKMQEYADRLPNKLSGGQQQRIALARVLAINPSVLLMDEPLSNLDAKLRVEMRSTIRSLQKRVGITTIYVTHDQEEALAVSDRIAVMNGGDVQQVASPKSLYLRPANVFVATFIGFSNLFIGKVERIGDGAAVRIGRDCLLLMDTLSDSAQDGQEVLISMRADDYTVTHSGGIPLTVTDSTFLGQNMHYGVRFPVELVQKTEDRNELVAAIRFAGEPYTQGRELMILPDASRINVFTRDGAQSLIKGVAAYEE